MNAVSMRSRAMNVAAMSLACAGLLAPNALAQSYDFQLVPEQGGLNAVIQITAPIAGTLIGDHDPVTNPGGTMTRPTLFGSGNHPIPYTATLVGNTPAGGINTQPAGQFALDIDLGQEQASIDNLFFDALSGAAPGVNATLNINYQTFYTSNPSEFFPGGFDIPVPLGQIAVTTLTMTQLGGPAPGVLTPLTGNQFHLEALVEVEVLLEADFNGDPISTGPIELMLPIAGTLTILDAQNAHLAVDIAIDLNETEEGPLESFEDIPITFDGPFSGQPVNLLLSGVIQSVTVSLDVTASLIAHGESKEPPCPPIPGDLNCSGTVGVPDLLILLSEWGPCANCNNCHADLTGSCTVGVADLLVLLANWG